MKTSPSHLWALFGVLGSELQLERRRSLRFGDEGSSAESRSEGGGGVSGDNAGPIGPFVPYSINPGPIKSD